MTERANARAIVFGATGLTGRFVTEHLRKQGVSTVAHIRPESSQLATWQPRFLAMGAEVSVAPWTDEGIEALAKGATHVFALLGTTQARGKQAAREGRDASTESYDAVDVALTLRALRAASQARAERFIYLSSVGTSETAAGAYLQARARTEAAILKSGVAYTIARPSFIVGERADERTAEKMVPFADGLLRVFATVGAKKTADRYRSITGEHLAQVLVKSAFDPASRNRVLESEDIQAILRSV